MANLKQVADAVYGKADYRPQDNDKDFLISLRSLNLGFLPKLPPMYEENLLSSASSTAITDEDLKTFAESCNLPAPVPEWLETKTAVRSAISHCSNLKFVAIDLEFTMNESFGGSTKQLQSQFLTTFINVQQS